MYFLNKDVSMKLGTNQYKTNQFNNDPHMYIFVYLTVSRLVARRLGTHDGSIGGGRDPPGRPPGSGGAPPPGRFGIAGAGRPVDGGNGGFRPPKELCKRIHTLTCYMHSAFSNE